MKIYTVTFNDGGWHNSLPSYTVVAEDVKDAINKVLEKNPRYKTGYDAWAVEFKIEGYIIDVYDEKTYTREKNLEELT